MNFAIAPINESVFYIINITLLINFFCFKNVMTRSMVDALSELCSPMLKGGNSASIAAMASDLFPQTEYRSLE